MDGKRCKECRWWGNWLCFYGPPPRHETGARDFCSKWAPIPPEGLKPECGNCTYWLCYQAKTATRGDCRRHSPPPQTTDRQYWCGDWELLDASDGHNKQRSK